MKKRGEKFAALTAYDVTSSQLCKEAQIPLVLVGDSASMVVFGFDTTLPINMEEMILLTRAVKRSNDLSFIVSDMPFMSYQASGAVALQNAGKLIKNGADAVKVEGGVEVCRSVSKMVASGIPVVGHLGLQPQSINVYGQYKVHGKTTKEAKQIINSAKKLEKAGVLMIVLECIPFELADHITNLINIPTVGIGSGSMCDGEIQVFHDIVGLNTKKLPKHSTRYLDGYGLLLKSIKKYQKEVKNRKFPAKKNSSFAKQKLVDFLKTNESS
ncbi:MAG: 3-methyl-2-oxobutanoate hydroxymethyltransferase [bacterium TMED198]|nr:MAG: 3-methyl-2-oxobutanoate hydroxymethyltransferase [bacterium TMED198]